jgi:hypothetical protein
MSSDDEYTDIKISREMIEKLTIPLIVKRAVASGLFKPNELRLLYKEGKQSVEAGIYDLGRILDRVDQSNLDTAAVGKAIQQIIFGAMNLGAFRVVTKSRSDSSSGGIKAREKDVEAAEKWKKHVRNRTEDLFKENPTWPGTLIRDVIKDVIKDEKPRPPGIRLPDPREIYEKGVLPKLRALKKA